MKINNKDKIFLAHLRKNARENLTSISRKTGIPISTLFDRLKTHENGLITKHVALIDFASLGFLCRVNISIKVNIEQRDEIKSFLLAQNCVNSLYKINNGYDYMIEGIFRHVKEMEDFMERFEKKYELKQKEVYYIIEDLKREAFMAEPGMI